MNYFNKQNTYRWFLFSCILVTLLVWPASSTGIAQKAASPALAGFIVTTLSPELAEDQGLPREQRGAIIMGIFQGSPAETAGLHEGDIIIRVQNNKGKTVDIEDNQQYKTVVDLVPAVKPLVLTILREGTRQTLQLLRSPDILGSINQPPPAAAPQTIKVASDGMGDCKSINGALLRSRPGDVILIKSGKYSGITVQRDKLTLAAMDPQNLPVLAGISFAPVTGVKIKELIISSDSSYGVSVDSGNQITISNCQIRGFTRGTAVFINSGTGITLDANIITGNWTGVYIGDLASEIKISHNLINKNSGGGISAGGSVEIVNNTIIENRVSNDEFCNLLYGTKGNSVLGVGITSRGGNATIYNNIIAFNNIGCLIAPVSQVNLEYNNVFQHRIDPKVWHVTLEDVQINGGNSNYLSQIYYQYKRSPLLALSASDKTTITPVLKFEPSITNINSNPFFADPQKGDYRLATDSPLAGKGRSGSYIGAYPPIASKQDVETTNKPPVFGISARPLTDLDRKTLGLASLSCLWITEVKKGSLAESLQIKVDDVILEVNGVAFKDNEEFKKIITTTTITTVKVFRGGIEIILTVPTEF